jgi:hypothetical protein
MVRPCLVKTNGLHWSQTLGMHDRINNNNNNEIHNRVPLAKKI